MADIVEHISSRVETVSWREPEAELILHAIGYDDPIAVKTAALNFLPSAYNGELCFRNFQLTPLGGGVWNIKAKYAKQKNRYDFNLHIGGEKAKMLVSLQTKESFCTEAEDIADGVDPIDFERAINVQQDKIEGADRYLEGGGWMTLGWTAEFEDLDPGYCTTVKSVQGHSNQQAIIFNWFGQDFFFDVNELVLIDADFKQSSDSGIAIMMKFDIQETRTDIEIGDVTHITKQGQDLLWVRSVKRKDSVSGLIRNIPQAYYIEKIYRTADFGQLNVFDLIDDMEANVPSGTLS